MRDALGSGSRAGGQMQLTILSAEVLKSKLGAKPDISISCNISELPNYHCNLIFTHKHQDLGPIGFLKFDSKRPLASAILSLKEDDFMELVDYKYEQIKENYSQQDVERFSSLAYLFSLGLGVKNLSVIKSMSDRGVCV